MKLTRNFYALLLLLLAAFIVLPAAARPMTFDDEKALGQILKIFGSLSGIIDKNIGNVDACLDLLEKYMTSNEKKILPLFEKIRKIEKEVDQEEMGKWEKKANTDKNFMNFMASLQKLSVLIEEDDEAKLRMEKIFKIFEDGVDSEPVVEENGEE